MTSRRASSEVPTPPAAESPPGRNEVVLLGRVAAPAEERTLPSGDVIATWRLVVPRGPGRPPRPGARVSTVDTLDCVAWTARARRTAGTLAAGDVVQVQGALRRRFWRAGAAAASRCEVEVEVLTRQRARRAPTRPAPGAGDVVGAAASDVTGGVAGEVTGEVTSDLAGAATSDAVAGPAGGA